MQTLGGSIAKLRPSPSYLFGRHTPYDSIRGASQPAFGNAAWFAKQSRFLDKSQEICSDAKSLSRVSRNGNRLNFNGAVPAWREGDKGNQDVPGSAECDTTVHPSGGISNRYFVSNSPGHSSGSTAHQVSAAFQEGGIACITKSLTVAWFH